MQTTSVVKFGARFLRKPKALLLLHWVEAIQKKRPNDTKIVISSSDKQGRAFEIQYLTAAHDNFN